MSYKPTSTSISKSYFSEIYESKFDKQIPAEPVTVENTVTGISRTVYKKKFRSVTSIPGDIKPVKSSTEETIGLGEYSDKEYLVMVFNGYFNAPTDGAYTFYTLSDDSSHKISGNPQDYP